LTLLVDENLAPGLVARLADLFPGSMHVSSMGMGSTPDEIVWDYAKAHGFMFLMDPEASVSALVFHHPDGAYFSVGEEAGAGE
jgi:predicted nuclease of predicted toxin-antitoxin system